MPRAWNEAKSLFEKATTKDEKLKIFLDDLFDFNSIDSKFYFNIFKGKFRIRYNKDTNNYYVIENINIIFSDKILYNPYNQLIKTQLKIYVNKNINFADNTNVIFMLEIKDNNENFKDTLVCDKLISFQTIKLNSTNTIIEILQKIISSNFAPQYNNDIGEYILKNKWPNNYNDFMEKRTNLNRDFINIETALEQKKDELNQLQSEKNSLEKEKIEITSIINKYKIELNKIKSKLNFFDSYASDITIQNTSYSAIEFSNNANIYKIFKSRLPYKYSDDFLISFLMALNTNQIITLFGKPGTGKTSFVINAAKALGAKLTVISVQNNWTDSADILGYYNPTNQNYESTEFVEALLEAKNDYVHTTIDEKFSPLHIICLDEMNLARVEYYFAKFLSVLQLETKKQIIHFLPYYAEQSQDNSDRLNKYKNFKLSPNIRFIGTINNDDTTNSLSPKVIDRSFFLKMDENNYFNKITDIQESEINTFFPYSIFSEYENTEDEELKEIINIFKSENNRLKHYISQMWFFYKKFYKDNKSLDKFCNLIIAGKILPAITRESDFKYNQFSDANKLFESTKFNDSSSDIYNGYNYLGG